MSLINDMLHDLEKRRGHEKQEIPAYEVPIVNRVASTGGRILLWFGGIALAAALTWAAIVFIPQFMAQPVEVTTVVEPEVDKVAPDPTVEEESSLVKQDESSMQMEQDGESSLAVTLTEEKAVKPLNRLLPGVELREDDNTAQLTLVFSESPEYQLIQNGDQDRPLILEFSKMQLAEEFKKTEFTGEIVKNFELLPQDEKMQLRIGLAEHTQLERLAITEKTESDEKKIFLFSANFLQEIERQDIVRIKADNSLKTVVEVTQTQQQQQQKSDRIEGDQEYPEEKHSSLTKKDNQLSSDRQAYADGMRLFRQGDLQAAAVNFGKALGENPAFIEARLQLIDVLQRQGRLGQAMKEARLGLTSAPGNAPLRKKYARLLFDDQRYDEAIDSLQKPPVPEIGKDQEYHALLAALLREAGQFRPASEVYARLLQVRPNESLWWLGLAVSMDQIGEGDQARRAYLRALALPGLAPQLQNYVQSRVEVL